MNAVSEKLIHVLFFCVLLVAGWRSPSTTSQIAQEIVSIQISKELAEVTAGATFYLAEIYMEFSTALVESERPAGLSEVEKVDYELVIEEEAYPFEERAIEVHEQNFELLAAGIYNGWVQQSLDKLAVLMPGRYAKNEISGGFLKSIDTFAYRMPIAPQMGIDGDGGNSNGESQPASPEVTAQAHSGRQ